jgi:hypothetical protein
MFFNANDTSAYPNGIDCSDVLITKNEIKQRHGVYSLYCSCKTLNLWTSHLFVCCQFKNPLMKDVMNFKCRARDYIKISSNIGKSNMLNTINKIHHPSSKISTLTTVRFKCANRYINVILHSSVILQQWFWFSWKCNHYFIVYTFAAVLLLLLEREVSLIKDWMMLHKKYDSTSSTLSTENETTWRTTQIKCVVDSNLDVLVC